MSWDEQAECELPLPPVNWGFCEFDLVPDRFIGPSINQYPEIAGIKDNFRYIGLTNG